MVGEKAFSNRFVDLCRLSLAHNRTIAEMCVSQYVSSSHGWDLKFYRNLHDHELESFANLSFVLDQVHLNDIWKILESGNRTYVEDSHVNQL